MESKSILKSKTVWANIATALGAFALSKGVELSEEDALSLVTGAFVIVNVLMRLVTKGPAHLVKPLLVLVFVLGLAPGAGAADSYLIYNKVDDQTQIKIKIKDNGDGTFSFADGPATQAVTGPLTDTQLRATAVPVSGTVAAATPTGTLTDRSGSITTGGTAQQLMAANSARKYLLIQNVSAGDLWFNFTTTGVQDQPSIKLTTGSSFLMDGSFVSTEAISIIGATTGQKFTAKEG